MWIYKILTLQLKSLAFYKISKSNNICLESWFNSRPKSKNKTKKFLTSANKVSFVLFSTELINTVVFVRAPIKK